MGRHVARGWPRVRRWVVAGLVALGGPLGGAGSALAAEKAIWGPVTMPNGASAFPVYERLGVDSFQMQLTWSRVAPTRPANPTDPTDPAYRWPAEVATALEQAERRGIDVALLVTGAPAWANGGRAAHWSPHSAQDFADFTAAASRRYPAVRRWMIWGEPNMALRFRSDVPEPQAYSALLDASYVALKRVSSSNVVIGGMTWTGGDIKPAPFVEAMRLPDGRRPRMDWFGHNPYPFRFPQLSTPIIDGGWRDISDLDTFAAEIDAAFGLRRGRGLPLWLSEYMIQSDAPSQAFTTFVSREEQAAWLTAGFEIADDLGSRVRGIGWFTLFDQPDPDGAHWGLYTRTGARKPSFYAFLRAPSKRLRPTVRAASRISRRGMARRGLRVSLAAKRGGRILLQLRRGDRTVLSRRVSTRSRKAATRLRRRGLRAGTYKLVVQAPRASTVTRTVRIR